MFICFDALLLFFAAQTLTLVQHRITLKKRFGLLPTQQPGIQF